MQERKIIHSFCMWMHVYKSGFSIHFEAHTPSRWQNHFCILSRRKNNFCTPCTIWCIVFHRKEKFSREVYTPRTPFLHPQLRTTDIDGQRMQCKNNKNKLYHKMMIENHYIIVGKLEEFYLMHIGELVQEISLKHFLKEFNNTTLNMG